MGGEEEKKLSDFKSLSTLLYYKKNTGVRGNKMGGPLERMEKDIASL